MGAYYLAGLGIECGLKACVAKHTKRYEFPDKKRAEKGYTHDLSKLVELAGLQSALEAALKASGAFDTNWAVVKDWTVEVRYQRDVPISRARDYLRAVKDGKTGVQQWIRKHW